MSDGSIGRLASILKGTMKNGLVKKTRISQDRDGRKESVKRSQVIYDDLRKDIITGLVQPGESLIETVIAARFECSQAPVREACIALSYEGFLNATPYKGFTVREITMKEIKDLYEMRLLVECAAAEDAASGPGPSAAMNAELEGHIRVQQEGLDPDNLWRFLNAEVGFHVSVAKASGNELLQRFVTLTWSRFQQFYYKTLSLRQRQMDLDTVNEHAAIHDAIRERDTERAKRLMYEHVLLGRETALKLYFEI